MRRTTAANPLPTGLRRAARAGVALLLLPLLALGGCRVTPEDIDYWTGTVKGPGKIVAVLTADKYEDPLRVHAGLALVRMEPRESIDGVAELHSAVRALPEETRQRLVDQMSPGLVAMMRGEDTPEATAEDEAEGAATALQIRAKDAAFLLLRYAGAEQSANLTDEVVDWFVVDFNRRNLAGNYSAQQVVRQLGAPGAARLVDAMNARLPQAALVQLAELINSIGDDATKDRGAERLIAILDEMQAEPFMDWLKERLREQLRARLEEQGREVEIDENRVSAAAAINRNSFVNNGALTAMRQLNQQRAIQDRLLAMALVEATSPAEAVERRRKALQAMEGSVREDQVQALLGLALDEAVPIGVRDDAFDRVSDSGATSALTTLWPVFEETDDTTLRFRVGSLILTLGGPDVIVPFFEKLDDDAYSHEELYGYGERLSQVRPEPDEAMVAKLSSRRWYDRVIALFYWQRRATAEQLSRIEGLVEDRAATNGANWAEDEMATVGAVAQAALREARNRLGIPNPEAPSEEEAEAAASSRGGGEDG